MSDKFDLQAKYIHILQWIYFLIYLIPYFEFALVQKTEKERTVC